MGCQSEFLCCVDCDLQVHLQNRTFVRFGSTPASYMRQHFKVTFNHALNDEEIPKQDHRKCKRQCVDERVHQVKINPKQMIELMLMMTMIPGLDTINL